MGHTPSFTSDDFAALMAGLGLSPDDGPFAVAVSGGPDSMALSLLAGEWADATYLIFDHGLRPKSANEAKQVAAWLSARGCTHHILTWKGEKPKSDIQAAARAARYTALEGWCRENGVKYLLLAHTMDDQAETFLMRLLRGSGVDGLAAMAAISPPNMVSNGPQLVRPLLGVKKKTLGDYLKGQGQDSLHDPSNENTDFTRIKVRQLLAATEIEGFDAKTLAATAARMARVRSALERETDMLLESALELHPEGYGTFDCRKLLEADEEIALRSLSRTLMMIGGEPYPQRMHSLERLYGHLQEKAFKGATLSGCQLAPEKAGRILVCREPEAITDELTLKAGTKSIWDDRFFVALKSGAGVVQKLGAPGWKTLRKENPELETCILPHPVRIGLPALVKGGAVLAVPGLGIFHEKQGFTAEFIPLGEK